MKLRISSSLFLFALTTTAFAGHHKSAAPMPAPAMAPTAAPGKFYVGLFGGGGSSNKFNVKQYGTAYYIEAQGGPLAVNAFGQSSSESASFFGAQLGYQAPAISFNSSSQWTLGPAVELEAYTMSNSTFNSTLSNDSARVPGHTFNVSYPMSRNIFLANAVINFNSPSLIVHPYIGFGIGDAVLRVSGANATQVSPAEPGVNHYNANPSDNTSAFAGQIKLGLSYDINQYFSIFADYRWLYIASTHYVFGSTIATDHPETSSWQVNMDSQRYNLANLGIRVNF